MILFIAAIVRTASIINASITIQMDYTPAKIINGHNGIELQWNTSSLSLLGLYGKLPGLCRRRHCTKCPAAKAACPGRLAPGFGRSESLGAGNWLLVVASLLYISDCRNWLPMQKSWLLVRLNSNGSLTDFVFAEALVAAGWMWLIYLYSPVASVHDAMRGAKGLWQKTTRRLPFWRDWRINTEV